MAIKVASILTCLLTGLAVTSACAQETPFDIHGEVEAGYVVGGYANKTVVKDHEERLLLSADIGSFSAQAAYFFYPFCDFNTLEESFLAYQSQNLRFRAGRLREEVGQSNWYDDWDSGFVFIPDLQHGPFFGTYSPWLTEPAVDCKLNLGTAALTLGAGQSNFGQNQLFPARFDHFTGRLQEAYHGFVLGLGSYLQSSNPIVGNQLYAADVRYGKDRWLFRAQLFYSHAQTGAVLNGFFGDAFYRPPGQDKVTLLARYQTYESYGPGISRPSGETLGIKYLLPAHFILDVNYNLGNAPLSMGYNKGWLFELQRVYRF